MGKGARRSVIDHQRGIAESNSNIAALIIRGPPARSRGLPAADILKPLSSAPPAALLAAFCAACALRPAPPPASRPGVSRAECGRKTQEFNGILGRAMGCNLRQKCGPRCNPCFRGPAPAQAGPRPARAIRGSSLRRMARSKSAKSRASSTKAPGPLITSRR